MHKQSFERVVGALLVTAALAAVPPAQAADVDKKDRDKEMLRRTQMALRAEQEQRSAAERERGALSAEKMKLQDELKRGSAQLAAVQGQSRQARVQLEQAQAEIAQLRAELEAQKAASEQARADLQARLDTTTRQLVDTRRTLAERTSANEQLIAVLERSTQALSQAEAKNRELHAAALKAVQAYRDKGLGAVVAQREPVFGIGAVQLENVAEELRTQIDAQRVPSAFK